MAKVEGPLMSLGARGSIGKTVTFFPWKGVNAVRKWLIPANPQTANQGDIRLSLGTIGRACRVVGVSAAYATEVKEYMPAGQTWISTVIGKIIAESIPDGSAFDTLHAVYAAHTAKADFDSEADALGLVEVSIPYAGATEDGDPGFQLYLLAKYATDEQAGNPARFNRTPYTTALASWTSTEIQAMVAEFS